jgi:hypothetical protein
VHELMLGCIHVFIDLDVPVCVRGCALVLSSGSTICMMLATCEVLKWMLGNTMLRVNANSSVLLGGFIACCSFFTGCV